MSKGWHTWQLCKFNKFSLTIFITFLFAYILIIYFLNNVPLTRSLLSSRRSGWQRGSSFGVFIVVGACRCTYVRDYPPSLSHTLEIAHTGNSHRLCCLTVVFSFLFRVLFWLTKILSRNYILRKTLYFIGEEMFTSQKSKHTVNNQGQQNLFKKRCALKSRCASVLIKLLVVPLHEYILGVH